MLQFDGKNVVVVFFPSNHNIIVIVLALWHLIPMSNPSFNGKIYISLLLLSSILSEFWEKVFFVIDLTKKKCCYAWITKYWLSLIYLMSKSHVEGGSVIVQGWEIIMYYMRMSWILKINIYLLLYALSEMTWLKGKKIIT